MGMQWIEIQKPCPVLNTPDFTAVFCGKSLPLNEKGHPYYFEFVALPGMRFHLLQEMTPYILQILWPEYDVNPLYIDRRFAMRCSKAPEINHSMPSAKALLNHMQRRVGASYVWGGNWADGIPEMLFFYPPTEKLAPRIEELWTFRGLDCSGLLFEASNGFTPRNTSQLLKCGKPLKEENLSRLLPMDMIIYPGHVLFVRDSKTIIESKSPFGVRICLLAERLKEIQQERIFIRNWTTATDRDLHFTIRRFAF
jgi:hypothetical protein